MKHYDEHTIELFVLNSEKIAGEREEFINHIDKCFSCREMYEEMAQFYKLANGDQKQLHEHIEYADSTSLAIKPEYRYTRPITLVPRSIPARVWQYARKKPVVSTFSGIGLVALITIAINSSIPKMDNNPAYVHHNLQSNCIEIYNKKDELLWDMKVKEKLSVIKKYEEEQKAQYCQIVNMDGNDKKMVMISHGELPIENEQSNTICLYNYDKSLSQRWIFDELNIRYKERNYFMNTILRQFVVINQSLNSAQKDIIINIHGTRSPNVVIRTNNKGDVLGRYYHMGNMNTLNIVDDTSTSPRVYLTGVKDDIDYKKEPVIIVLDPKKLTNNSESSVTRGFGYSCSKAEELYIKLPFSDLDSIYNVYKTSIHYIISHSYEKYIRMLVWNSGERASFEYIFDKEFHVIDIRCDDETMLLHKKAEEENKLKTKIDTEYFKRLKQLVQYWDGRQWQKQHTRVLYDSSRSLGKN